MDLVINNIPIPIEKDGEDEYLRAAALKTGMPAGSFSVVKILSKALDLRTKDQLFYNLSLVITTDDSFPNKQKFSRYKAAEAKEKKSCSDAG